METLTIRETRILGGPLSRISPAVAGPRRYRCQPTRILVLATVLACLAPASSLAEKTDILILKNGNQITGEIKSLDRGKLSYKTDAMSTLSIEWDEVARLTSVNFHLFELEGGKMYFGALVQPSRDGILAVGMMGAVHELNMEFVVGITPVKQTFWTRLNGSLSLGFSLTKASEVAQLTVDGSVKYRGRDREAAFGVSSIVTAKEDDETTRRVDINLSYGRKLKHKWALNALGAIERNDELGLDLRASLTPSVGYHLIQTNASTLAFSAGLSVNKEKSSEGIWTNNVEVVFSASYEIFYYDSPKTDVTIGYDLYPSLTIGGRFRTQLDISASRELFKDFFWSLTFNQSRDTKPATEDAATYDYSIVTSLGWSFG